MSASNILGAKLDTSIKVMNKSCCKVCCHEPYSIRLRQTLLARCFCLYIPKWFNDYKIISS